MAGGFDLLGDPIPEGRGKPGRTGHVATSKNALRVKCLLAAGMKPERIAGQLGISTPTLRKHYFLSGRVDARTVRSMALAEGKARQIVRLEQAAAAGSVSAAGKLYAIYERLELEMMPTRPAAQDSTQPMGKKERLVQEARKPAGSWAGLLPGADLPN